ncbi:MAG: DUF3467 domain-containing protein [Candidatus Bathyarchaeia archaeon]
MFQGKIEPKDLKVETTRAEDYKTIIVDGVFGGSRSGLFEMVCYTDELSAEEALSSIIPDGSKVYIKRTLRCRLVLTPIQAKALLNWLTQSLNQYEKQFGKIPLPERQKEEKRSFLV